MRCKEAKRRISLLFDGELDESCRRQLEAHLQSCAACSAEAELLEQLTVGLQSFAPLEPREAGWDRLVERIEAAQPARRRLTPAYALACFTALSVAVVLLVLSVRGGRETAKVPPRERVHTVQRSPLPEVAPQDSGQPERVVRDGTGGSGVLRSTPGVLKRHPHPRIKRETSTPPVVPAPSPKNVQPEQEYVAEVEPALQSNEISYEADRLLARGMSVLVEASAEKETGEGGKNL